jgi:hypothetical protein
MHKLGINVAIKRNAYFVDTGVRSPREGLLVSITKTLTLGFPK